MVYGSNLGNFKLKILHRMNIDIKNVQVYRISS